MPGTKWKGNINRGCISVKVGEKKFEGWWRIERRKRRKEVVINILLEHTLY
jgi:hypothetical protein